MYLFQVKMHLNVIEFISGKIKMHLQNDLSLIFLQTDQN